MEYNKVKSVAKQVKTRGPELLNIILNTMSTISKIVGDTLGPGGHPVLIERFEHGLPSSITKDGVSVFRSLGFDNPSAHCIMEAARDAAIRTANEAGDGTTTATILAEAIVRNMTTFCNINPKISPQRVVRHLESLFKNKIEPTVNKYSIKANMSTPEGRSILHSVAKISGNGDVELADAVLKCFELTGDQGNVTITELNGPSSYEVEQIEGYPIPMGFEESCTKFYAKFINDVGNHLVRLENPVFVIYHGAITEIQTILPIMNKIGIEFENYSQGVSDYKHHNVVIIATGFSDSVLGSLAVNFPVPTTINVFPLLAPKSPMLNGQLDLLMDMAAITGATLFDPLNHPLETAELADFGPGVEYFEAGRFKSIVVGKTDETSLLDRVIEVETQLKNPESELDKLILQERVGKLTGGIAKLKVIGSSSGELKEKRDRAEDAVCAVRGTIRNGCLPGGGWMLLKLCQVLGSGDPIVDQILKPALLAPVERLLLNCGIISEEEGQAVLNPIFASLNNDSSILVYDAYEQKHVSPIDGGVLDSTPAVLEAIRNSISIATLLGTLGGTVVFGRDLELERSESSATQEFLRNANHNPANDHRP